MVKRIWNRVRGLLPGYGWACFLFLILCQILVFSATRIPLKYMDKLDMSIPLDARIPFRAEWIIVYVLSFLSWLITLLLLFRQRKEHVYRNSAAYFCSLMVTLLCFLAVPACIERPEVTGRDFFSFVTRIVYFFDQPNNLFPSLHVILSYYCWRCLFDAEGIPRWYRRFNFIFLLLVCCSIVLVKQHVLVDIPSGFLVGAVPLELAKRFRWERLGFAIERKLLRHAE